MRSVRRIILGLLFLLSILILGDYRGSAQEKVHPSLNHLSGLSPGSRFSPGPRITRHTMYPLGFSKGGAFAYLAAPSDPAGGNTPYFRIVNLITDRLLHFEKFDPRGEVGRGDMQSLVEDRKENIGSVLKRFAIEPLRSSGMQRFPYMYRDDRIEAVIRRKPLEGKTIGECGGRDPEQTQIVLVSEKRGSKVIAGYDGCASNTPYIEAIEGFIKSPLEERIVVLAAGTQYLAGDVREAKFYPVGAHLTAGFGDTP